MSSWFSVRKAGAAENRREFAHDGTARRADWVRRKVLSEREYTRVVSVADNLMGLERANRNLESMTGRDEEETVNFYFRKLSRLPVVTPVSHVTGVTLDEWKTLTEPAC